MFKFLKEKLNSVVKKFTREVEEESEKVEVPQEARPEPVKVEIQKKEIKQEVKPEPKLEVLEKVKEKDLEKEEIIPEKKAETKTPEVLIKEEVKPVPEKKEEKVEETRQIKDLPISDKPEKSRKSADFLDAENAKAFSSKGFFGKIFGKKEEKIEEKKAEAKRIEPKAEEKKIEEKKKEHVHEEKKSEEKKHKDYREEAHHKKKEEQILEITKEELEEEEEKEEIIRGVKITYFVHGTTTDNEKDLATGWAPGELSQKGIFQSKTLPDQIKGQKFDVVFCSDLKRAIDSAELSFKGKYKIIVDKRLREANYGDYTGKEAKLFKNRMVEFVDKPFPNGESYKHVEYRIAEFLNDLLKDYKGKHVAIVAHQAPQLALDVLLDGKTWEQAIKEDWRLSKAWQPGWGYEVIEKIDLNGIKLPKEEKVEVELPTRHPVGGKVTGVPVSLWDIPRRAAPENVGGDGISTADVGKAEEKVEKKGFFTKLTETFTKINLSEEKFEELFWDLEVTLLENNVAVEVIAKIKEDLKKELMADKISRKNVEEMIEDSLKKSLEEVLDVPPIDLEKEIKNKKKENKPYIIAVIGVNGSGKTTTIAKLCQHLKKQGHTIVLAAADTFRAAAIQQLEHHADKLDIKMIKHDYNSDPAAVAFDAIKHAEAKGIDVVIIDTAGRLHSNDNLMNELKKLIRVNKPDLKLFVGESITGNDCVEQAKVYDEIIGIDAIILSKADVDEKGGAALSISYVTKKPVMFIGTGQTYDDLKEFDRREIMAGLGF